MDSSSHEAAAVSGDRGLQGVVIVPSGHAGIRFGVTEGLAGRCRSSGVFLGAGETGGNLLGTGRFG